MKVQRAKYTKARDLHNSFQAKEEVEIQGRFKKKDVRFLRELLRAMVKAELATFWIECENFSVYFVDAEWVRCNLDVDFGHGGTGITYPFIGANEIWLSASHSGCICLNVSENQPCSPEFLQSTLEHEVLEFRLMRKGMRYWVAHQRALKHEVDLGLLKDPYAENQ